MPPGLFIPLLIVFAVAAIAMGVYAMAQERKRREALAALASSLGLTFDPGGDHSHDNRYPFSCFTRGHSRKAYNTLEGRLTLAGRSFPCRCGDYLYKITSSNGKSTSTRTYRFSYLLLGVPFRGVKNLSIRSETWFDKVKGALGFDDIDFESEEFSRKFHVQSSDRRFAYAVVHPRMMEFLLAHPGPPLEITGGIACLTNGSTRWSPEQFKGTLGWAAGFFEQWPAHVIEQFDPIPGASQ